MSKFEFSITDMDPSDPLIPIYDDANLHHFYIMFYIDEISPDQECGEILENNYNISTNITRNEDMENCFSVSKDAYKNKIDLIDYLVSKDGVLVLEYSE